MAIYLLRRLLATIPTILGVALVIFVLFNLIGGDPALQMAGKHASAESVASIRHELGLDRSLPMQFVEYLRQMVTFDYGRSFATRQKISDMIVAGIAPSLALAIPAFFLTTFLSVSVALLVAYFRGRWVDKLVVVGCILGMSIPMLAYILFGQYWLAYRGGLFPISGFEYGFPDMFGYVALPLIIWVTVSLGYDVRFFRTALLEETSQDYVRTARAKGLAEPRVFFKHILKNAMVPIVTNIVIEIPLLILGSFLLESFFGIPGIGGITIAAVHSSDFPVIKAMTTLQALLFIFGNLATDVIYTLVDPRVRLS